MSSFLGGITGTSLNGALYTALSCWLADLGASVVDVNVDLAMTDGVFVVDDADLGASVVDLNVDLAITDGVFAVIILYLLCP